MLDFGISKFDLPESNPALTVVGTTMGTLHYMSHEQLLSGNDVDQRADVYSLGVVLYECLTGVVPFAGDTMVAQSVAISRGEYVGAASCVREGVPQLLNAMIANCLTADRNKRIADMFTLRTLLEEVRTQLPGSSPTEVASAYVDHRPRVLAPERSQPLVRGADARETGTDASTEAAVASVIEQAPKRSALAPALLGAAVALVVVGFVFAVWRASSVSETEITGATASEGVSVVPMAELPVAASSSGATVGVSPASSVERKRESIGQTPVIATVPAAFDRQRETCAASSAVESW